MKTKLILLVLCAALLFGGSGLYGNFRETEKLTVIQTVGVDAAPAGVVLSAAADEKTKLCAAAPDLSAAQEKLQDISPGGELFFAHTAYALLGEAQARQGIAAFADLIGRSTFFRLDMPVFVTLGGEASGLVLSAADATELLRSTERNLEKRGSCHVYSVGEVVADLDRSGAALLCAVKTAEAKSSDPEAENGELCAEPAGYAILKDGRLVGSLDPDAALGVELLLNRAGPAVVPLGGSAVQLDKAKCELAPEIEDGRITALSITLTVSAALLEKGGAADLAAELEQELKTRLSAALDKAVALDCDFMQLRDAVAAAKPLRYRTLTLDPKSLRYTVKVDAAIDRSFDLEK